MMWIISGPSSVGKSTFIESSNSVQMTGLRNSSSVIFPDNFDHKACKPDEGYFVHYNILRLFHEFNQWPSFHASSKVINQFKTFFFGKKNTYWNCIKNEWQYYHDKKWLKIARTNVPKKAIVLVASYDVLLERVRQRVINEKSFLDSEIPNRYQSDLWLDFYNKIDLIEVYSLWCDELRLQGIDYILVDSTNSSYRIIDINSLPFVVNSKQ